MEEKSVYEYKPKDILLNSDTLSYVSTEYAKWQEPENNRSKYKELTITLIADIALNLFAIFPSFSTMPIYAKIISVIILVILSIYTIVCATKWNIAYKEIKNHVKPILDDMLVERAKEDIKYTAISRIAYKHKGVLLYLTGYDYFLPHCNMDKNLAINKQQSNIIQSLQDDFGIKDNDIIKVTPIDDKIHYSIKPIHGSIQMNAFVFYDVTIKEQAKSKLIISNSKRRWMSIENMKKNTSAMSTNKDVIDLLDGFPKPSESFVNILGNIRIIWNITSKCQYNCAICATHDESRKELELRDKYKVLNNICTAKHMIKNVDFAGGDPLNFDDSTTIIQSAIEQLGQDRVSITTTGRGISGLPKDGFLDTIRHCEITIDASHNVLKTSNTSGNRNETVSREEDDYSNNNIENITLVASKADSLTINIPIINDDLDDTEINNLIAKISSIKKHTAGIDIDTSLIRLMPVGKLAKNIEKTDYIKYNPIDVAKKIKSRLEEAGIVCKLHCSFRVLPEFNAEDTEHCNMLENKLGIDCAGNVFACAWGGYIHTNDPPTKNPFYLGNLTRVPLVDILTGNSKTNQYLKIFNEIENKNHRDFCSVVSYYVNKDLFNNHDPLAQNPNSNSTP